MARFAQITVFPTVRKFSSLVYYYYYDCIIQGGTLVGAAIAGRRVLIVDDVITAGTAIRESVQLLAACQANLVAVTVLLDRQEKVVETATESAIQVISQVKLKSDNCSSLILSIEYLINVGVQQVQQMFSVPVISIVRLSHLVNFISTGSTSDIAAHLPAIEAYRSRYGVQY